MLPVPFPTGRWKVGVLPCPSARLLLYQGLRVYPVEKPLCPYGPESPSTVLFGTRRHSLSPGSNEWPQV